MKPESKTAEGGDFATWGEFKSAGVLCLAQHFGAFYAQCVDGRRAEFGAPCTNCPLLGDCEGQWMEKVLPLLDAFGVKISLARGG